METKILNININIKIYIYIYNIYILSYMILHLHHPSIIQKSIFLKEN